MSTSGASRRLSWFISISYSKSLIARSPLTIARAPSRRANSTTRTSNASARTLPSGAVASRMKPSRSSVVEERLALAHRMVDDADHDLVEQLRRARDDVEVAVGDRVVGAGTDGDAGIRCHGGGCGSGCRRSGARGRRADRDGAASGGRSRSRRVRRAPARRAEPAESSRPSAGASRYGGSRRTRSYASPRADASRSAARAGPWTTRASSSPSPSASRLARMTSIARPSRSTSVAVCGPARERLDAQRARPGEQVEHPGAVERAEHREQRLAHAIGGRPRVAAPRRPQPPAAEAPGHDPHAATGSFSAASSSRGQQRTARAPRRPGSSCSSDRSRGRGRARGSPRPRAAARSESARGPTGACR